MKKLWNKIKIFMLGLFAPLWGILPIVTGIYVLCILHRYNPWLAILMFFVSLFLITIGCVLVHGIGALVNDGLMLIEEEEESE